MANFFKFLASLFCSNNARVNLEKKLENAVKADNVPAAHKLLSQGVDVNIKIRQQGEVCIGGNEYETRYYNLCLLSFSKSKPMSRLLKHFGALPLEELEKRWEAEDKQRQLEWQEREKRKQQEEKQRLAAKAERDNLYLDEVLH